MRDNLSLGGSQGSQGLVLKNFEFGHATEGTVFEGTFEGLIGLCYPDAEIEDTPLFFDQLIASRVLERNLFAFYMSMIPTQVVEMLNYVDDSEITFGYFNEARYEGKMNRHKVRKD